MEGKYLNYFKPQILCSFTASQGISKTLLYDHKTAANTRSHQSP